MNTLYEALVPDAIGAPGWVVQAAIGVAVIMALAILWAYLRGATHPGIRLASAAMKLLAVLLLAFCLVEPLRSGMRPRPGANIFGLLVDNSRSMRLKDPTDRREGHEQLARTLKSSAAWRTRLEQDFDVRSYAFDRRTRSVNDFEALEFDGTASSLVGGLETLRSRFGGRPVGGVLLLTDGNATDLSRRPAEWSELGFPVYPILMRATENLRDVSLRRVAVRQTNFETAPVTVNVEAACLGMAGKTMVAQLKDENDKVIQEQTATAVGDDATVEFRFQFRPETIGVSFYRADVFPESERSRYARSQTRSEVTLANNFRFVAVDRGGGPFRVLYVAGRPNWEFKFLRRALQEDEEVHLVGILRIAHKEAKFAFRDREVTDDNRLFEGFKGQEPDDTERYDQAVTIRLGIDDAADLRDGFPKSAEPLFDFDAVVLDDIEAGFFKPDQLHLLRRFVAARGGGLLLLGGQESFAKGGYQNTPLGDLAPIYAEVHDEPTPAGPFQLDLTREGWLQPWTRVRSTESAERKRLNEMPGFRTLNHVGAIKPGATVLARVRTADGQPVPALVVQRFGKGRCAALMIGDLWRWGMHRKQDEQRDLEQAWRQTIRWLIADVPQRVEAKVQQDDDPSRPATVEVRVRDGEFEALDNAEVTITIKDPNGVPFEVTARASDQEAGLYTASYWPRLDGGHRVTAVVKAADGSEVGRRETGWAAQVSASELADLMPNRALLDEIAQKTGGEVVPVEGLEELVASLPNRKVPVVENWVSPYWHQPWLFAAAILLLCGEWGLRRWKGLP